MTALLYATHITNYLLCVEYETYGRMSFLYTFDNAICEIFLLL